MKKFFLGLSVCLMAFAISACDDSSSTQASGDSQDNASLVKGSFPSNGDPDFSCVVTTGSENNGNRWVQYRLNIPKYKGMVERITLDASGTKTTQYYEESYFNISPFNVGAMCAEFYQAIKETENKGRTFDDYQCGNGVSYFVYSGRRPSAPSEEEEDLIVREEQYFKEDCADYEEKWERGEYDRSRDD